MNIQKIYKAKSKTYLIAEVGLAHDGSLGIAKSFIDKIAESGADAVKFQMHIKNYESSKYEKFRVKFSDQDKTRGDYWQRTAFKYHEWKILKDYSRKKKLDFICSPFSLEAVPLLKKLKVDAVKIASGEFNNILMLKKISKELPNTKIILSTGLSDLKEIDYILRFCKKNKIKRDNISLLQCRSEYPTKIDEVGHKIVNLFKDKYKVKSGLSDHSGNLNSLIAGIAMGSDLIELHVTFDKDFFGPDTKSSITFDELKTLSDFNKDFFIIKSKGASEKKLNKNLKKYKKLFNKGIFVKKKIEPGDTIKENNLIALKPMQGISVVDVFKVIGKKIKRKVNAGQYLKPSDIK